MCVHNVILLSLALIITSMTVILSTITPILAIKRFSPGKHYGAREQSRELCQIRFYFQNPAFPRQLNS